MARPNAAGFPCPLATVSVDAGGKDENPMYYRHPWKTIESLRERNALSSEDEGPFEDSSRLASRDGAELLNPRLFKQSDSSVDLVEFRKVICGTHLESDRI